MPKNCPSAPLLPASLLAIIAAAAAAHASEPELFGTGTRSAALAGTGAADAQGYEAVYANPAGLIEHARRRLTIGYVGARYRMEMDGAPRGVSDTNGVVLGASLPLPFGGVLRDRLALGLNFYFPTDVINRARDRFLDEPRLSVIDSRTQLVSLTAALGARIHPRVSIGAGVLVLAALLGEVLITSDPGGRITTVSEQQLVAAFTPILGARVAAARWLTLGLAFRGEATSRYDIRVKNSLVGILPIQLPQLRIAGTSQYDPLQMALEGSALAARWLRLNLGLTWKHWSKYENPIENATAGAPPFQPPRFHDTVVPRVAAEAFGTWGAVLLAASLGYFFEWSPAPDTQAAVLLDADRHVVTAGFGLTYTGHVLGFQVDAFAQWHHADTSRRVTGDFGVFGATVGVDL